jgi:hypothetical protein
VTRCSTGFGGNVNSLAIDSAGKAQATTDGACLCTAPRSSYERVKARLSWTPRPRCAGLPVYKRRAMLRVVSHRAVTDQGSLRRKPVATFRIPPRRFPVPGRAWRESTKRCRSTFHPACRRRSGSRESVAVSRRRPDAVGGRPMVWSMVSTAGREARPPVTLVAFVESPKRWSVRVLRLQTVDPRTNGSLFRQVLVFRWT